MERENILILDFGSQYTQLIARRIRELGVFCRIEPGSIPLESILDTAPRGVILSGGPESVYEAASPANPPELMQQGIPVLGICYGMQLITHQLGGTVEPAGGREYGRAEVRIGAPSRLFEGIPEQLTVWMSHGDRVTELPQGFRVVGTTDSAPEAAIEDPERAIYGIQFHPEVVHTSHGREILGNFLFKVCQCRGDWSMGRFLEESVSEIRATVGEGRVVCALSGGVDSAVMAMLVHRAIGERLICLFVDNGLLRKGEAPEVLSRFRDRYHLDVRLLEYGDLFLSRLKGIEDPEVKRRVIGRTFIQVFEEQAKRIGDVSFLAQGTIYPDRIESQSVRGPSAVIKTHHNVGGLPEVMKLQLVEPLKELFKDEVRSLGRELGLDTTFVNRHPFPGPGLAVRILGEVTVERVAVLQEADAIFLEEIETAGLYDSVSQAFAVLLPVQSVGVMGDDRTYEDVLALRCVTSTDFMTADWSRLPYDLLARISNRIVNEVRGINRVVYDISSKPPSTIEWE
jgi:GMP synthase (glutamine-hydrolysing)